ncbi:sensor histidine kinase, partial [Streptomyces milbemycinicus]
MSHPWPDGGGKPWPTGRLPWRSSLAVAVVQLVGTGFAAHGQPARTDLGPGAAALLLAGPVLLLARHRRPGAVVVGTAVVTVVYLAAGYPYGPVFVSVVLACVAAVAAGRRVAAWSALGLLWGSHLLMGHWLYHRLPPDGDGPVGWGPEVVVAAWAVAIVAGSELVRVRREQWARERAEREAAARRRADEERLRIARELHDVVAHHIALVNVQAGVASHVMDSRPDQAKEALAHVRQASRSALDELRATVGLLRQYGDPAAPTEPAPGLAVLDQLVDGFVRAGMRVEVRTEPPEALGPLPGSVDLTAYRVVQEALTNVHKHAGPGATAGIRIARAGGALEITVEDDGGS